MKSLIVLSLSIFAVFFYSCKEDCVPDGTVTDYLKCIHSIGDRGLYQSCFVDGVVSVDVEIFSRVKGEAYIWLDLWRNNVQVDGFQICAYQQYCCNSDFDQMYEMCDSDVPYLENPIFIKKIYLPENDHVPVTINITLPESYAGVSGTIFFFRTNEDIEASMKTKLIPEEHKIKCSFDRYYYFFPDSSFFSYLMSTDTETIAQFMKPIGYHEFTHNCTNFKTPILGHSFEYGLSFNYRHLQEDSFDIFH